MRLAPDHTLAMSGRPRTLPLQVLCADIRWNGSQSLRPATDGHDHKPPQRPQATPRHLQAGPYRVLLTSHAPRLHGTRRSLSQRAGALQSLHFTKCARHSRKASHSLRDLPTRGRPTGHDDGGDCDEVRCNTALHLRQEVEAPCPFLTSKAYAKHAMGR